MFKKLSFWCLPPSVTSADELSPFVWAALFSFWSLHVSQRFVNLHLFFFFFFSFSVFAALYAGSCLPVSSIALFCLYYCNRFAGPDLCGCAGSFTIKLHGNWVKVEYLLEEAIWRQAVWEGGGEIHFFSSLSSFFLSLLLPLYPSPLLSSFHISHMWKVGHTSLHILFYPSHLQS